MISRDVDDVGVAPSQEEPMRSFKLFALMTLTLVLCVGCGPQKPAGVPKLSPAKITVVKGSTPVKNANVFLVPDGAASGSWSVVGKTDETGVAVVKTTQGNWEGSGAPEGSYKIYLTKFAEIEEPDMPEDMDADEEAKKAFYEERAKRLAAAGNEIPPQMNAPETSGLAVTVGGGAAELTIDLDASK